jgi:hypothetical protein
VLPSTLTSELRESCGPSFSSMLQLGA